MSDDSLSGMLKRIDSLSNERKEVSFGDALDAAGDNTFASIVLLVGVIMMVPGPADIPGVPSVLGIIITIACVQMLIGREHIWVPNWLEKRRIASQRLQQMINWLQKPARWMDRITKQRYTWLIDHAGVGIVAIACILISSATPILEFVPFSANVAGAAITTFALALIAKDGLIAVLALIFSIATLGIIVYKLL